MKVAIYARVSTLDQDVAMQLRDLREYAGSRKFEVFKEYVDRGVSGSKVSRPALDALMDSARKRRFDAVLVWRFDRFARSTKHLALALDEFRSLGVQFVSYNENIDTSTPMGAAMFTIISAMAQLERDIIRERVIAGVRTAQAAGTHCGRPRELDPAKAKALRAKGLSMREIAVKLGCGKGTVERALKAGIILLAMLTGLASMTSAKASDGTPPWTERSGTWFRGEDTLLAVGVATNAPTLERGRTDAYDNGLAELRRFFHGLKVTMPPVETQMTYEAPQAGGTFTVYRLLKVDVSETAYRAFQAQLAAQDERAKAPAIPVAQAVHPAEEDNRREAALDALATSPWIVDFSIGVAGAPLRAESTTLLTVGVGLEKRFGFMGLKLAGEHGGGSVGQAFASTWFIAGSVPVHFGPSFHVAPEVGRASTTIGSGSAVGQHFIGAQIGYDLFPHRDSHWGVGVSSGLRHYSDAGQLAGSVAGNVLLRF